MVTYSELVARIEPMINVLISHKYEYFVCGGALGFDTFVAMYICSLKMRGFNVKLVLMIPCADQTKKWNDYDKTVYDNLMERADEVIYISQQYYSGCMQKRNRAMVDASSACICYLSGSGGSGTRSTVNYAYSKGLSVVNVARD